ncbi:MAG: protein phosphatase 2C domain-containing protein [Chloroflexi bacterium]|nr:protein phosphatase 2C domain-containing protein [Chloroflexota bacterium]
MNKIRRTGSKHSQPMEEAKQSKDLEVSTLSEPAVEEQGHTNGAAVRPDDVADAEPVQPTAHSNGLKSTAQDRGDSFPVSEAAASEATGEYAGEFQELVGENAEGSISRPDASQPDAPQADSGDMVELPTGDDAIDALLADAEPQTAPLSAQAEQEELTPLPINAVVDGRYVVQSQLHHGFDRNLYRVTARRQQRCATCGRLSSSEADVCKHCGAELNDQQPADFYLMAESYRPEALMQDPTLMDLHLYHPNLVPVVDFYSYKPFGHARYYAVAEPRQGVRLSQLSLPRPSMQVLNWAMQLADALDYLHISGVVGAGAEADDILVQGDTASLASLQNARTNVASIDERTQQQNMDLARLAATMYEAYTGHPAAMSPEGMLPMPPATPEQVGGAFRAAIEPIQGAGMPISAAQWRDQLAGALNAVAEMEGPGRPVSFVTVALTDVGRLRDQNQDSFGMIEFAQASVERPMRIGLYVIADGMGGHKGGEVASALAVQAFCGELLGRVLSPLTNVAGERNAPSNEVILQGMVRAVQSANERIFKARDNRQNDMGTTLVSALVTGGKAFITNVGDSRLYLFSKPQEPSDDEAQYNTTSPLVKGATAPLAATAPLPGTGMPEAAPPEEPTPIDRSSGYVLTQVSVDHSLVHRLVELGQLDAEEAKVHPHRNFIYRSIGGPPPVEVDTFVRNLRPGDRILLCSDGLNSMIEDSAIEAVLASEPDPNIASQRLIDLANEAGGHDNITVLLIDIDGYLPLAEHPYALNNA